MGIRKKIEMEFSGEASVKKIFQRIGCTLPIRRSFRKWVSEKLQIGKTSIQVFIEEIIEDEQVESFWKDEILTSALLSDYSYFFFETFEEELIKELLTDNNKLLKKITFLLRAACTEPDKDLIKQLELDNLDLYSPEHYLVKPKGNGWNSLIAFVYENLDKIGIKHIHFFLPIIHDWNDKFKQGSTTRLSSLIALRYYQRVIEEDISLSRDETDNLIQTIMNGSLEIKDELKEIFDEIIQNQWKYNKDPYYDLSYNILTTLYGTTVCKVLPDSVLQIADLFWSHTPSTEEFYYVSDIGVDHYFGIKNCSAYFPPSSYKTPIYWLLQSSLKKTIDFILNFTNKTIEFYTTSNLDNDVKKIDVFIDNSPIQQYISNRIWNIYRGTQVSSYILESLHAALEKYLLKNGKNADSTTLEGLLFYLIKNSKSASISSVVTSIVLAYPEKTFNVATILFKTKEFFLYDANRLSYDQSHKISLSMVKNSFVNNAIDKFHEDERLEACDDEHRKWALENLFLKYQFEIDQVNKEEVRKRQVILWDILDNYYKNLPSESEETDLDKTWRLFLSRMDLRKMAPKIEKVNDDVLISFNPEIDSGLKRYQEKSQKNYFSSLKYTSLNLWARKKMENNDECKQYQQYENNPKFALKEVKEIISKFKTSKDENFYLFNNSIPANVCSVLLRDYFEKLSKKEKIFCKDIILEVSSSPFRKGYIYQVSDGVQPAISVLPILFDQFPEEKENIKFVLLFTLFKDQSINMIGTGFNAFSIMAIRDLWKNNFMDAQSILVGYLILKPKYEAIKKELIRNSDKILFNIMIMR